MEPAARPSMFSVVDRISAVMDDRAALNALEAWHTHRCAAVRGRKGRRGSVSAAGAASDPSASSCTIC